MDLQQKPALPRNPGDHTDSYMGDGSGPQVDWAYTPLCIALLKNETEFNKDRSIKVFMENEIDYVIEMIKS